MAKDPTGVARKWAERTQAASGAYTEGVQSVTTAPGQQAASKADTWSAKLALPDTKARFRANVARVSLEEWKTAAVQKGASRFGEGARAAQPKMQSFMTSFLPFQESITTRVRAMPNVTLEDGIRRATEQIRGTAGYKRS